MTAYALRLENATDTAARVRLGDLLDLAAAGPLTARTGIRPAPGAGDVAQVDGTMQVTVEPFVAWVQGGISTTQGGYPFVLDAQATLVLSNGDPTLDRTDTIAAVIHDDPFDGSGLIDAAVVVIQGTPGSGAPALPDNCLPLRDIDVPAGLSAGTGGLAGSNLAADRRTYTSGLGGVVTVASSTERDALPAQDGTVVYRTDSDTFEGRAGGTWRTLDNPASAPYFHGSLGNGVLLNAGFSYTYTAVEDSHSGWSTNLYTIPEDGVYRITVSIKWGGTPGSIGVAISQDGVGNLYRSWDMDGSESYGGGTLVHTVRLSAGAVIRVSNASGSYTTQTDAPAENNTLTIEKIRD